MKIAVTVSDTRIEFEGTAKEFWSLFGERAGGKLLGLGIYDAGQSMRRALDLPSVPSDHPGQILTTDSQIALGWAETVAANG